MHLMPPCGSSTTNRHPQRHQDPFSMDLNGGWESTNIMNKLYKELCVFVLMRRATSSGSKAIDWKDVGLIPGESSGFPLIAVSSSIAMRLLNLLSHGYQEVYQVVLTTSPPSSAKVKEIMEHCHSSLSNGDLYLHIDETSHLWRCC